MPNIRYPLQIEVPLREKRTYLQSASVFDFLVARTGVRRKIALTFRRKIECEVEALPAPGRGDIESYPARFSGESDCGRVDMVLTERQPLTPVPRREPYNEAGVLAGHRIDGLTIEGDSDNGASAIDRIVALNKRLINQTTAPQKVLVFSKIALKTLPDNKARLKIHLKSRLGLTLFRSVIFANDEEVGEIIFYGT
jgi:hypothetical protein